MSKVLEIKVDTDILPSAAKDPAGHVSGEARYLDCDIIRAVNPRGRVLATWKTPLCPWTRKVLVERLERLADQIGDRDKVIAEGLVHAANLIQHGTLIPPGSDVKDTNGAKDHPRQYGILREEDLHGRSEAPQGDEPAEPTPAA